MNVCRAGQTELGEDEDEEVAGFLFQRLIEVRPELAGGLRQLRTKLVAEAVENGGGGALKVWEMEDLGLQAVKRISTATKPLAALRRISGEFPSIARTLSRLKLSPAFKEATTKRNVQLRGFPQVCIETDELCIKSHEFCTKNDGLQNVLALNGLKVGSLGGRFATEGADEYGKRATVRVLLLSASYIHAGD